MSEAIPGMPRQSGPAKPKDAAAVVMFRRAAEGVEVYWLKRERQLAFAGGFYAFPGGRVDASDALVSVEGLSGVDAQLRVCAVRELFEETGVLIAVGSERLTPAQLKDARKGLL